MTKSPKPYKNNKSNRAHRHQNKGKTKSMILLKSTVYMLFIVFATLLAALFILKGKRNFSKPTKQGCGEIFDIKIAGDIDEVQIFDSEIFITTKKNSHGNQELIKLDKKCFSELSRIRFVR